MRGNLEEEDDEGEGYGMVGGGGWICPRGQKRKSVKAKEEE